MMRSREFVRLAKVCEEKIENGKLLSVEEFNKLPFSDQDRLESYKKGRIRLIEIAWH